VNLTLVVAHPEMGLICWVCNKVSRQVIELMDFPAKADSVAKAEKDGYGRFMCGTCLAAAISSGKLQLTIGDEPQPVVVAEEPDLTFEVSW
jgi:hypothetical protein